MPRRLPRDLTIAIIAVTHDETNHDRLDRIYKLRARPLIKRPMRPSSKGIKIDGVSLRGG